MCSRLLEFGNAFTQMFAGYCLLPEHKNFCLHGGIDQCVLKLSWFQKLEDPHRYLYTEKVSKNISGCLAQIRVKHKSVFIAVTVL